MVATNLLSGMALTGNPQGEMAQPDNRLFSYDREYPTNGLSPVFQVNSAYGVLRAFNLVGGRFDLVQVDPSSGLATSVYYDGEVVSLTPTNNVLLIDVPGFYQLLAVGVTGNAATVTLHESVMPPIPKGAAGSGAQGPTGATGATGATGPAGQATVAVLENQADVAYVYVNANAKIPFAAEVKRYINPNDAYFTWNGEVFTPTDGLFHVDFSYRIDGFSGGTYFTVKMYSGTNVVAQDTHSWGSTCEVTAVSGLLSRTVAANDTSNVPTHIQIDTDADMSTAVMWPDMTYFRAWRMGDNPAAGAVSGGGMGGPVTT